MDCVRIATLDAFRHGNMLDIVAAEKNALYEKLVSIGSQESGDMAKKGVFLMEGMVPPFSYSRIIGELNGDYGALLAHC